MADNDVVILSGARSAIGKFQGSLSQTAPIDLGAEIARSAIERAGISPATVDATVVANVLPTRPRDLYLSRALALDAGIPEQATALQVNRLCGSGLQALVSAAQQIKSGDSKVALAGGVEVMSQAPYSVKDARKGLRMGEGVVYDWLTGSLTCPMGSGHMGITAENIAERYGISRQRQDEFAAESYARAIAARDEGRFDEQIHPVSVRRKRENVDFDTDEGLRETTVETLSGLKPAFQEGGTVTAGNGAGINDAAALLVLASEAAAREAGATPLARIVSWGIGGVDPAYMGLGPVAAVPKALEKAGLKLSDIDLIESNEAFSAQALAVQDQLGFDPEKTNIDGGAVALGHPIGATGAILTVKLLSQLRRTGKSLGLVTLCIGGGQGIAAVVEAL
ncbi:acetyl-CoA C-acyltransferase [Corynebacterium otitidis]|nr:acetyl-CoA C-acyltransferase [Corynebacterium otitidis]EJZ82522.1 acetyl-CoA C-acetyltransferase [Corynebacterium otitidis ATCC 51513]